MYQLNLFEWKPESPEKLITKDKVCWINKRGEFHRLDGPACILKNGTKFWYKNGVLHRTDGSACEYAGGDRYWWVEGERHRIDGPAIEYADGSKCWCINNEAYTEEEFKEEIKKWKTQSKKTG